MRTASCRRNVWCNANERRKTRIRCEKKDGHTAETSEQPTQVRSQDHEVGTSNNQLLPTTQMVTTIGSDDTRRSPGIIEQLQHRVTATSTERGKKRQHENDPVLAAKSTTEGIGSANLNLHRSPRLTQHIQTQPEICMDKCKMDPVHIGYKYP